MNTWQQNIFITGIKFFMLPLLCFYLAFATVSNSLDKQGFCMEITEQPVEESESGFADETEALLQNEVSLELRTSSSVLLHEYCNLYISGNYSNGVHQPPEHV